MIRAAAPRLPQHSSQRWNPGSQRWRTAPEAKEKSERDKTSVEVNGSRERGASCQVAPRPHSEIKYKKQCSWVCRPCEDHVRDCQRLYSYCREDSCDNSFNVKSVCRSGGESWQESSEAAGACEH
eukprot:819587-Rhodomonas_salina.1